MDGKKNFHIRNGGLNIFRKDTENGIAGDRIVLCGKLLLNLEKA